MHHSKITTRVRGSANYLISLALPGRSTPNGTVAVQPGFTFASRQLLIVLGVYVTQLVVYA